MSTRVPSTSKSAAPRRSGAGRGVGVRVISPPGRAVDAGRFPGTLRLPGIARLNRAGRCGRPPGPSGARGARIAVAERRRG
ncbi:hypothetical protein GCM10010363_53290 [Streptomyces omiyaensis]|nr:hypothetical protein GCM10010363_53290 [Streptomyces omiyaensis]